MSELLKQTNIHLIRFFIFTLIYRSDVQFKMASAGKLIFFGYTAK